jgi:hypothetical protein
MKRILLLIITLFLSTQFVFADNATKIKIKLNGSTAQNQYFLCLPDVGCLSVLAAQKGKVYPIFRSVDMSQIYITDRNNYRVSPQASNSSCNTTVNTNQTVTVSGNITVAKDGGVRVNQLHCSIS